MEAGPRLETVSSDLIKNGCTKVQCTCIDGQNLIEVDFEENVSNHVDVHEIASVFSVHVDNSNNNVSLVPKFVHCKYQTETFKHRNYLKATNTKASDACVGLVFGHHFVMRYLVSFLVL